MNEVLMQYVQHHKTRFIILTGGVCSSLGKGVLLASIGTLLKNAGYSVTVMKCDPYLNVDPGTMSPLVHGEVFVTTDGAETDLDLGHYERVLDIELTKSSSLSSGQIYQKILAGERSGKFLGDCIQIIPHVVDGIIERLLKNAQVSEADFVLVEIGGTVGDMEGEVFMEAVRQLKMKMADQLLYAHLSFVPQLLWSGEVKTKPTQHSVMLVKRAGLIPDMLFLRSDQRLNDKAVEKVSLMCGVPKNMVVQVLSFSPLYKVFLDLAAQSLHTKIQTWFATQFQRDTDLTRWERLIDRIERKKEKVVIGLVAKYIGSNDPYISVVEAIKAACYKHDRDLDVITISAVDLENETSSKGKVAWEYLKKSDGIIIPGGFDQKGFEGKVAAVTWTRMHNIPTLGLCFGMQVMLIEHARNLAGLSQAATTEIDPNTPVPLVSLLEEQEKVYQKGASMRLGAYMCAIKKGTKAYQAYQKDLVSERHRHRYEFNNAYKEMLERAGVIFSGINPDNNLVEIIEFADHPFMLATQFHPEFLSRPDRPHPLFDTFVKAVITTNQKA